MKKAIFSIVLVLSIFFCFPGCYDAIFQEIRSEIELNQGSVSGFVNDIIRFNPEGSDKQYLLISNGALFIKDASLNASDSWFRLKDFGLPETVSYSYYDGEFNGEHIFKVAADKNNIYVLSYVPYYNQDKGRNVPKEFHLYTCAPKINSNGMIDFSSGWNRVEIINDRIKKYISVLDTSYYSMDASIHLFCTNAYNPEHRKAYIRIGGSSPYATTLMNTYFWAAYELDGTNATVLNSGEQAELDFDESKKNVFFSKNVLGAFYFNDEVIFTNYLNPTTNESKSKSNPNYAYICYDSEYLSSFSIDDYKDASSNITGRVLVHKNKDGSEVYYEGEFSLIKAWLLHMSISVPTTDAEGKTVYPAWSNASKPEKVARIYMNTDSTICSLAVCSDALLMGTGSYRSTGDGIYKVSLDETGKPNVITTAFTTNAADVMCKPYIVRSLLSVEPDLSELKNTIYASMDYIYTESTGGTSIENRGMWAYYPEKLEWNRD